MSCVGEHSEDGCDCDRSTEWVTLPITAGLIEVVLGHRAILVRDDLSVLSALYKGLEQKCLDVRVCSPLHVSVLTKGYESSLDYILTLCDLLLRALLLFPPFNILPTDSASFIICLILFLCFASFLSFP